MNIFNARWANPENTVIACTIDDQDVFVPVDPQNTSYAAIVAAGVVPAPFVSLVLPAPRMRRKLDVIARMTDTELETAVTQRALLPLRDRLAWEEAVEVDADDPRLVGFFSEICGFGAVRTSEILA